jgi:hypothetical protein
MGLIAAATALTLGACSTIVDENVTTAVIQSGFNAGERYQVRERTLQGPQGIYKQTSVVYKGVSAVCRIDSPNDCAKAAERLVNDYSLGGLSVNF